MFFRLPTGFLPTEDQGAAQIQFRLPAGATLERTKEMQLAVEDYLMRGPDKDNFKTYFIVAGGGQGATGQNAGQSFINLADFDHRHGKENSADAIVQRARSSFSGLRDAQVFALIPPAIRGLGQSGGFNMQLQNTSGMSQEKFEEARDRLLQMAQADPSLNQVRLGELPDVATLKIDINQERISALGLSTADVNNTLSAAWGGRYVNDFIDRGRVKRVFVQGDAPYRATPDDIDQWSVRNDQGDMVPFSSFADATWSTAPVSLSRFLGIQSYEFQGQPAPGKSTGDAMTGSRNWPRKSPASASPGRANRSRSGCRRGRRRCSMPSRCWSCSSALPRSTKAGRSRSPCCWSSRWDWSARFSRSRFAGFRMTSICRSACSRRWAWPPRMPS